MSTRPATRTAGIADVSVEVATDTIDIDGLVTASGLTRERIAPVLPAGRVSVLPPGEKIWDLATRAAATVMNRSGIPPEEVGMVLWAGSAEWGRPFWSPAAKVAGRLGVRHAHCLELSNFCNAGMAAVALAAGQVDLGVHDHVLVLVADALSRLVDHTGDAVELFNFGDAAAAVLVSAWPRYRVAASAMLTDPQWVDCYTATPGPDRGRPLIHRGASRHGLREAFLTHLTELTHQVLGELRATPAEVARYLVTHGHREVHLAYLDALGVDPARSVWHYDDDGHLGGADPLLALEHLHDRGVLGPDDLVVVATIGAGFTFGVTALRVAR